MVHCVHMHRVGGHPSPESTSLGAAQNRRILTSLDATVANSN